LLEEVGENLSSEGGGGGGYLCVHENHVEEDIVHVGPDFFGLLGGPGSPIGRGDATADDGAEEFNGGSGVGLEESSVDLT